MTHGQVLGAASLVVDEGQYSEPFVVFPLLVICVPETWIIFHPFRKRSYLVQMTGTCHPHSGPGTVRGIDNLLLDPWNRYLIPLSDFISELHEFVLVILLLLLSAIALIDIRL